MQQLSHQLTCSLSAWTCRKLAMPVALACLLASQVGHALDFQFNYIDDMAGTFASRGWLDPQSLFQQNIRAAGERWGRQFDSSEQIVVRVDTTSFAARAGGAFSFGRFLETNSAGKQVWEAGPLTRILTGDNPGEDFFGYDIVLGFDASFVENVYWFDPVPQARSSPVPLDKGDFVSVVLHELGHGFGMAGNRDYVSGEFLGDVVSQFDDLSFFGGDGNPFDLFGEPNPLFFAGPAATSHYGGDVPLTHKPDGHPNYGQNFYHLSACDSGASDGLEGSLMNGCVLPHGERLTISPLEAAMLSDLGYPLAELATADFNRDGAVDALDLAVWSFAFDVDDTADADGDGDSDGRDFLEWQRQSGSGGGPLVAASTAVPEPSALALLLSGLPLVGCRSVRFAL